MKQTSATFLQLVTIVLLLVTGCSPKYYTPNTQNVPLISEKGETNLTLSGNGNQVEFQGAWGVTNGFALKANGGLFIPKDLDNGNGGSGNFVEIGGGYFKPITPHLVFESYAIFGLGKMENHLPSTMEVHPETNGNISAGVVRYGIQPNFGYKSKYFTAAVSTRFVNLHYNDIKGDLIYNNESQTDYLRSNQTNFLMEPAFTIKGGFEKVKLQMQLGYSMNLSNSSFRQDNAFLTMGLNFNFK